MLKSIDIETYDPNLQTLGNGVFRKDGSVLCATIYDGKECRTYWPERYPDHAYKMKLEVQDPSTTWIAHNGIYDYDWIQNGLGYILYGKLEDTMTRAGLINEYCSHYDLDSCCEREKIQGKDKGGLEAWWEEQGMQGDVMSNLVLVPDNILIKYNQQDAIATYNLYLAQQPKIEAMGLQEVNELEADVMKVILKMRKNGIRVNLKGIEDLRFKTKSEKDSILNKLYLEYGLTDTSRRGGEGSLPWVLNNLGLTDQLLRTQTGPSVAYDSLIRVNHPIIEEVIELKRKQTLLDKYLNSALVDYCVGDRIHSTLKPTLRDEGGTITGRFSMSEPNGQNFSARADKGGDLVRGVFIPEEGMWLGKFDYSQIELRLLAHFAVGPGSQLIREQVCKGMYFHKIVQDMLQWKGADGKRLTKNFNFGCIYGMGLNTFKKKFMVESRQAAAAMGMTTDQYIEHYYHEYFRKMTFIKPTMLAIEALTRKDGSIRSLGGRLHRSPPDGGFYKMTNYMIQGSAADINKMGLVAADKAGIFEVLPVHLTVHDETVASIPKTKEGLEAAVELQQCMTKCIELKVPIDVEPGIGYNWYKAGEKYGHRAFAGMCKKFGVEV